jgi:hypothetical protein
LSVEQPCLIYEGEVPLLRDGLRQYLTEKAACYVLFDNLDKGWSSQGLRDEDVLIVRSLISACEKIERYLGRRGPNVRAIVFLRNDIYEFLIDHTPDRGKYSVVTLDWRDRDLLKLLVQRRMQASKLLSATSFWGQWHSFCATHVRGEPSFDFLVDRCLMRPRYLLRLINACRTAALNREHAAIEAEDVENGLTTFSEELVIEADAEMRDVIPEAANVLYNLIHEKSVMSRDKLFALFPEPCRSPPVCERLFELMLWSGLIGFHENSDRTVYIYDVGYNLKMLRALSAKADNALFRINPAFEPGLGIV